MKFIRFSFLMVSLLVFGGCASMTSEDVGKGVALGGIGSGSSGLAVLGAAVELAGSAAPEPAEGTPEFEQLKKDLYGKFLTIILTLDFNDLMAAHMTDHQVSEAAVKYCQPINEKVAAKGSIMLKRKTLKRLFAEKYLPKEEEVPYQLTADPFEGKCEQSVARAGRVRVKKLSGASPSPGTK